MPNEYVGGSQPGHRSQTSSHTVPHATSKIASPSYTRASNNTLIPDKNLSANKGAQQNNPANRFDSSVGNAGRRSFKSSGFAKQAYLLENQKNKKFHSASTHLDDTFQTNLECRTNCRSDLLPDCDTSVAEYRSERDNQLQL